MRKRVNMKEWERTRVKTQKKGKCRKEQGIRPNKRIWMSGPHPMSVCIWWRVGFWGLSAGPRPIGIPKRLKARGALYIRDNRPFGLFLTFTSGKRYGFFFLWQQSTREGLNAVWSRTADTFGHLISIAFSHRMVETI